MENSNIILALDGLDSAAALALVEKVQDRVYAVKIHELYDIHGVNAIIALKKAGAPKVWVDFKLHDIPETVKRRAAALVANGADILTVHASNGVEAMKAAKEGAGSAAVYAVTVLTSLGDKDVQRIYNNGIQDQVEMLAYLALDAGMDGIVCSPMEVEALANNKEIAAANMELVTPGVRSQGKETHDQMRFGTPLRAIVDGATRLVIGRQITQAADPVAAIAEIEAEISEA